MMSISKKCLYFLENNASTLQIKEENNLLKHERNICKAYEVI